MSIEAEVFERTFPVGDAGELVLSNISGTVEIRSWDYPEIKVAGTKRTGGLLPWVSPEEGFRATRIEMEHEGSRVVVRTTRHRDGFWGFVQWLGGVAQVDYVVRVPRRCNVVVDLVAGHLNVDEVRGNVIARTVSAGTLLRHLTGNLATSTVSGGVSAEDISGKAALRTVSGGIRAAHSRFSSLTCQTVSGRVELETPLEPDGSYEFQTVSGNVELVVPRDTRCSAELQSMSGTIRSTLPAQLREVNRGHWRAEINGGGTRVNVKSVSGSLRFAEPRVPGALPAGAVQPAVHPTPPSPPAPAGAGAGGERQGPEERVDRESIMMMILSAVERGELTVEEAAEKLSELDALTHGGSSAEQPTQPSPGADQPAQPSESPEEKRATDGE